jgi:hypothetical protein
MKFRKGINRDDIALSVISRFAFSNRRSEPIGVEFDECPSFYRYSFGYNTYNIKRNAYDCWKQMYRLDFNDEICYWNGEDE